jgi:sec-independent protein translocase protein TatA
VFGFGVWEIILVVGVVFLFFGAKRLPQIGKGLGEGIRNFKGSIKEDETIATEDRDKLPGDRGD